MPSAGGSRSRRAARSFREALKSAGYATAGFFTFDFLDSLYGFGLGFDKWERVGADVFDPRLRDELMALAGAAGDMGAIDEFLREHSAGIRSDRLTSPETIDRDIQWLDEHEREHESQPFFLFVHLFDVHDPYKPPPEFDRFGDPSYDGPERGRLDPAKSETLHAGLLLLHIARRVSLYDGGIAFVDDQVGRLLARLRASGLDEDTLLVIVTADGWRGVLRARSPGPPSPALHGEHPRSDARSLAEALPRGSTRGRNRRARRHRADAARGDRCSHDDSAPRDRPRAVRAWGAEEWWADVREPAQRLPAARTRR